jgi:glucosylceramidase
MDPTPSRRRLLTSVPTVGLAATALGAGTLGGTSPALADGPSSGPLAPSGTLPAHGPHHGHDRPHLLEDPSAIARHGGVLATAGEQEVVWEQLPETDGVADGEVRVDLTDRRHTLDGFGPALTHSAAWLLLQRPRHERLALLRDLFSPTGAIRLNTLRIPLGTSDFVPDDLPGPRFYSLADRRGPRRDRLAHLSLARDERTILAVLREILAIAGQLTVIMSPWSAPAWMKTSGDLIGGQLIDDENTRELYADYLARSVAAYQWAVPGLHVDWLTVQNEPLSDDVPYPCMGMSPEVQVDVIRRVREELRTRRLHTQVLAYDHNWDRVDYPTEVLDELASDGINDVGAAFHAYDGEATAVDPLHETHPDAPIWFTEQSGTQDPDKPFDEDFADGIWWMSNTLFLPALAHHHRGVVLFNLVLDQDGGPGPDTFTNGTGLVQMDTDTGELTLNSELYVLAHHSRFLPPGSRVVGVPSTEELPTLAVERKDGTVVVVLHNNAAARAITVSVKGRHLTAELPGWTLATYVLPSR